MQADCVDDGDDGWEYGETVMEHSQAAGSKGNGFIERAVQHVEGQVGTVKAATASRVGVQIRPSHCLLAWLAIARKKLHPTLHSQMCRERIQEGMRQDPLGMERLAQFETRTNENIAEKLQKEGETLHASVGGRSCCSSA